jgi:predicted negative regulator of RcsB-dependent stress response
MSNHLDLEEQEQLEELKHFWKQYGQLINAVLIAILLVVAGWNAYGYWSRQQAAQASALFDEIERVARAGDTERLDRVLGDMKDKFASTAYAQQASLMAAKVYANAGKNDAAKSALLWVADKSSDEGYAAIARLRLAGVLIDTQDYDEALKQLSAPFPGDFVALAADRRGDVYSAQGNKALAGQEYLKAFKGLEAGTEYRRMVDVKLAALGLSPAAPSDATAEVKK